ncbi:Cytochrome P450, E-class, group IV [Heracleum sosnowskyi]|uniref:Cytochrome P450, E-class, group IV n=1 Tax=Heracleum sosnowskyi TaxID=360622 RepID=A0AAD8MME8_9APIA|nr:Cytochrome P450, E-class, group IV [Heracleum sosnowskyi]
MLLSSLLRFYTSYKKQLHSLHSPSSFPLIGCLVAFYKNRYRLIHWYTDLLSESHSQTIVVRRLGARRTIITANPDNVEYILKTKFDNFPKGKPFTEILGDFLGSGIFNVDGSLWNSQRKLASHEFSTKSLREFMVNVLEDEVENKLFPLLDKVCGNDGVVDLQHVLRSFAFDTICKVALGIDPCCLDDSKPAPPLANAFDAASEISAMRGAATVSAVWKMKRALNIGSEKKLKEAVAVVHESVDEIIRVKKKKMNIRCGAKTTLIYERDIEDVFGNFNNKCDGEEANIENDLLSRLLSAGTDDEMVRDMVISFLMAGRDTTSSALTWLFWLIASNEFVTKELLNEVMSLDGLDFEKLKEMNYTKACLCESMRLYPPVVWDSKHAVSDDILPDGTVVCKGDRVTYFPYGMGRMEELWGKDKLEFRPDRWFDEPGLLKIVSPYKFPVFQAGPRVCLGKEMAFIQMKYVVASVMRRFEIQPVCLEQPVFVPLLTGHMAGGFRVKVSRRV